MIHLIKSIITASFPNHRVNKGDVRNAEKIILLIGFQVNKLVDFSPNTCMYAAVSTTRGILLCGVAPVGPIDITFYSQPYICSVDLHFYDSCLQTLQRTIMSHRR